MPDGVKIWTKIWLLKIINTSTLPWILQGHYHNDNDKRFSSCNSHILSVNKSGIGGTDNPIIFVLLYYVLLQYAWRNYSDVSYRSKKFGNLKLFINFFITVYNGILVVTCYLFVWHLNTDILLAYVQHNLDNIEIPQVQYWNLSLWCTPTLLQLYLSELKI